MAKITQYYPTFYTGFEPKTVEFNTQEELLNIDWVKSWSKEKNFYRYSIILNDEPDGRSTLMAEYDNGEKWYVMAFIDDASNLTLPEWSEQK